MIEVPLSTASPLSAPDSAVDVYQRRLAALGEEERRLQRRHLSLGYARLVFGIATLVLLLPPRLWALLPILAFVAAARAHDKLLQRLAQVRRTIGLYRHAVARTEDRWSDLPTRSTRLDTGQSLFASDLDLFGPGSLFNLLCEARTSLGEDTLAAWLLEPAPVATALRRQQAIRELRSCLRLREATAEAPGPAVASLDLDALTSWAELSASPLPSFLQGAVLMLLGLFLAAGWLALVTHSLLPVSALAVINAGLTYLLRSRYLPRFTQVQHTGRSLHTAQFLARAFEREPLGCDTLRELQSRFGAKGQRASDALSHLAALAMWMDARSNYVVRLFDLLLPISLQLALLTQSWQRRYGTQLRVWLRTMAEFEALLSLAAYSFEHSEDPFPEFTAEMPVFRAQGLTHPLLAQQLGIRNDVTLGAEGPHLLLVSGSNMSGKSTLLRSVGINAVLAFAGAPVRAHSLSLSPLTVAASIHTSDSLQAGQSRFYAEILRLRSVTEAARSSPHVLFLLDELLAGTNSSDRQIGAQGIVEELLRNDAIGLLSTHDLALTQLTAGSHLIRNAHFEDQVAADRLLFDYRLRDGVLQQSNGVALMRLVGLDV